MADIFETQAGGFSPHAWGWSAIRARAYATSPVFPTRVGMVRFGEFSTKTYLGFPHTRGDGPASQGNTSALSRFSPHAWGWSELKLKEIYELRVFPTRVGMVR